MPHEASALFQTYVILPTRASLMIAVCFQGAVSDTDAIVEADQSLVLDRDVSVAGSIVLLKKAQGKF